MNIVGVGSAAGLNINTGSATTIAGTLNVTGVGQTGITMSGSGTLNINTGGAVTTDYFTRSGGTGPFLKQCLMAVNKQYDLGVNSLRISGSSTTANPTLQFQNGATATGITSLTLGNAAGRRGTLNVLSGAHVTLSATTTIAANGQGTLLIDGA